MTSLVSAGFEALYLDNGESNCELSIGRYRYGKVPNKRNALLAAPSEGGRWAHSPR